MGHWCIRVDLSERKFLKHKRQKKEYGTPYIFPTRADAETWGETFRRCVTEESDAYEEAFYALMRKNETANPWIPEDKRTPTSLDTTLNGNGSSIYSQNGGSVIAEEGERDQSRGRSLLRRVARKVSTSLFRTGATDQKRQRKEDEREKEERDRMEREKRMREKIKKQSEQKSDEQIRADELPYSVSRYPRRLGSSKTIEPNGQTISSKMKIFSILTCSHSRILYRL